MKLDPELYQCFPLPFLLKMQSVYDTLKKAETKAADYILSNPDCLSSLAITEIAKEAGCSEPTFVRLSRKLGYSGFLDLRNQICNYAGDQSAVAIDTELERVSEEDAPDVICTKLFSLSMQGLSNYLAAFDGEQFRLASDRLCHARKIGFFGAGDSNTVAYLGFSACTRANIDATHASDHDIAIAQAKNLTQDDAAVIVSHSGRTRHMFDIIKILNIRSVPTIVITSFPLSPIAKRADIVLLEYAFQPDSVISRLIQISIIDALVMSVVFCGDVPATSIAEYTSAIATLNKM